MNIHITVSQSGWISTTLCLERDEFPSCHRWMNFHCRMPKKFRRNLINFTKSMDPCRQTPYVHWKVSGALESICTLKWRHENISPLATIHVPPAQWCRIRKKTMWQCVNRDMRQGTWKKWKNQENWQKPVSTDTQVISRSSCINVLSYSKSGTGDILHQKAMLA